MIENIRVFADTASVIYYTQKDKNFYEKTADIFKLFCKQNFQLVFSDITLAKACVYQFKENEWAKNLEKNFIRKSKLEFIHTSKEIALN